MDSILALYLLKEQSYQFLDNQSLYYHLQVINYHTFSLFLDINLLLAYSIEHDERLKKYAPLFFKMCVPGLSEEYKMEVFY